MADEDWLRQDEKEQGKPKVVLNDGRLKGTQSALWLC